jgi:hypothetical protein
MDIRRRRKKHEMQGDIWGRGKSGASAARRLTSDREQREAQKDERDNCVNTNDKRGGQHDGDESTKEGKKAGIRWIYHRSKKSTSANQDGEETIPQPLTPARSPTPSEASSEWENLQSKPCHRARCQRTCVFRKGLPSRCIPSAAGTDSQREKVMY